MKETSILAGIMATALAVFLAIWFKIFIFGSLLTSGVKAVSGNCEKEYAIETPYLIKGNWFCPSEKK